VNGLKFYEASHRYKLDGAWVPGVTTILGVLDKPALPKWAAGLVAEYIADNPEGVDALRPLGRDLMVNTLKGIPWQRRDDAAARGTAFHILASRILHGEAVDVPQAQVPLVENALRFMEEYEIEPLLNEAPVASREHRYAGTVDIVADSRLGRAVFDWKSGKRIYPRFALQLAAYGHAEFAVVDGEEVPVPEAEAAYGVHIREDGYDVVPLTYGPEVFREFLVVRAAYDINKRVEGDWREPGSGYAALPLEAS
jgi:hypothetical protein